MNSFDFYSPTKVIFGRGVVDRLAEETSDMGRKALFVYGRESIKKSGLYEKILSQMKIAGVELIEHGGVSANPELGHALEGVEKARRNKVDFIIGAGGGSVIDESKGIAAGAVNDVPLWDLYERKAVVESALPIVAIQTLPATSSETNLASVLTNTETNEKFGLRSPHLAPEKAFLDPELTFSIPAKYTAYACFDIMSHMLEGYFTTTADFSPVHDGFVEGLVKAVMKSLERVLKDSKDYDARSSIMWAGALAWNGIANAGLEGSRIPNHMLEHPLSSVYNAAHGAGLAVVMPAWLEFKKNEISGRIKKFGKNILEIENADSVDAVIAEFKAWIKSTGCPLSMKELGIDKPDIPELVKQARTLSAFWNMQDYTDEDLESVYRLCV